jgi:hypothetical protein
LASKAYQYAPTEEQKARFRSLVNSQIVKLLQHSFAAEVVEYIYSQSSDQEKREMIFGVYGNFQLILKELQVKNKTISLKDFMEQKPQLVSGLLEKIEPVIVKLIEKGQTRHTIVQAILADYLECET